MNDKIEEKAVILPPFKHVIMTIGELPTSYVETMTYYEMLVWFTNYLGNTVIPAINENGEAVIELQELFVKLQTYVNDYFDNLDVQEEINNKLDDMADSGQLTDIIAQYLGLAGMITFDTVADMKVAENLVNGSKCKTLGFHSYNDGGGAIYKIRQVTNDDVIDEMYLIEVYDDLLVAELVFDEIITPEMLGAYGDNTHDDTIPVQACLSDTNHKHAVLSKAYKVTSALTVPDYKLVDGGGSIYSTTSCFDLDGKNHLTIKDLKLYPQLHGIHIYSTTGHSNYNLFENIFCNGANTTDSKGLFIETTSYYINEFTYRNLVFWNFKYGIYATAESTSPEMAKHTFYDCSTETSTTAGQYIKNGDTFTFYNCRHGESISCKWITEGTCNELLIVGGSARFNTISNANFSENTNGQVIGGLRFAGINDAKPARNGLIIGGKVIPCLQGVQTARVNVGSSLTIAYGQQPYLYFNFNSDNEGITLTLPAEYYGGDGKINEFFVRTNKETYTSTVVIGSKTKTLPAGLDKHYRFTLSTASGGTDWFVEEITNI